MHVCNVFLKSLLLIGACIIATMIKAAPDLGPNSQQSTSLPAVSAPTFSDVSGNSATVGGTIDSDGGEVILERGVFWSLEENFDPLVDGTRVSEEGVFNTGTFTIALTNLPPVSTIYFLAFARNENGFGFSPVEQFQTGSSPPIVAAPRVDFVDFTSAVAGGTLVDNGGSAVFEKGVIYSTDPDFDPAKEGVRIFDDGDFDVGDFGFAITGLEPFSTYYFVVYAVNSQGTGFSSRESFVTIEDPVFQDRFGDTQSRIESKSFRQKAD